MISNMKHYINKLSAFLMMLMCVSATVQAALASRKHAGQNSNSWISQHTYNGTELNSEYGGLGDEYGYVGKENLNDIRWVMDAGKLLTFTGRGEMEPYNSEHNSWKEAINQYSITKVTIGEGITKIGNGDISNSYFTRMGSLSEVSLPSTLKEIGNWTFFGDYKLTSITLPESLERIGEGAFSNSALNNIVIPASVTNIEKFAFNVNNIKTITLNGALTIGSNAFRSNGYLTDVYLLSDKEISAADDAFDNDAFTNATLHINNKLYYWAKKTSPWNQFKTIVPLIPFNVEYTDADNNIQGQTFNKKASDNVWTLTDGALHLAITEDIPMQTLTYTRNFSKANQWQALYVPFEMEYSDWADKFDVADINNFHEYTDENGVTEKIELEVRYVKSGKLQANTPYLIRAKAAGEQTIVLNGVTLKATETKSIDCSSTERKYTFTGTYDAIDHLKTKDYIFLSGGRLSKTNNDTDMLKPMRWYLTIEDYFSVTGKPAPALAKPMSINVIGDGEATGIVQIENGERSNSTDIYNLNGMRLTKPQKGINIVNGKKIIVK